MSHAKGSMEDRGDHWTTKDRLYLGCLSPLGTGLLRLLGATWRVRFTGAEHIEALEHRGQNWIYAFWHGGLLPLIYAHRRQGVKVLVSTHRDGELVARVITRLGFSPVRGSSTRGGGRALFTMAALREGAPLGVAPDGPKGPAHMVQPGIIYLAQRAALPIVPLGSAASPCWRASSWDRFAVPLAFSRCVIGYGEPLWVPSEAKGRQIEDMCAELEHRLNSLQDHLEELARGG